MSFRYKWEMGGFYDFKIGVGGDLDPLGNYALSVQSEELISTRDKIDIQNRYRH